MKGQTKLEQQSYALFLIRLVLGYIFLVHGGQKVLGWFGGPGLEGFVKWAAGYGIPNFISYLAAYAEFIGGALLFTGIATEIGALLVIGVMLGAVFIIHWPNGFFVQNGGFEYTLNLIFFAIATIIGGPGKFPLWDPFAKFREKF